ncbi:MAG: tetratricopeptide repeat protein [bacterium]
MKNIILILSLSIVFVSLSVSQDVPTFPTAKVGNKVLVFIEPKIDEAKIEPLRQQLKKQLGTPAAAETQISIAMLFYDERVYSQAVNEYKVFLSTYNKHQKGDEAQVYLMRSYSALRQDQNALDEAQKFIVNNPGSKYVDDTKEIICHSYYQLGKYQEAINQYAIISQKSSKSDLREKSYFLTGKAYGQLSRYDEGISHLEQFVRNNPSSELLADTYVELGRYYTHFKATDFKMDKKEHNKVFVLIKERLTKAIQNYQLALSKTATSDQRVKAQYELASTYLQLGEREKAIEELKTLLSLYPSESYSSIAGYRLGVCLFELKKYGDAIDQFAKLERIYPDYPNKDGILFFVGQSYLGDGKKDLAAEKFRMLLSKYPKSNFKGAVESILKGV